MNLSEAKKFPYFVEIWNMFFKHSLSRIQLLDIIRGYAFVAMFFYHIFYFSNYLEITNIALHQNYLWKIFQISIAGTFFFVSGVSLYLVNYPKIEIKQYFIRMTRIGICAAFITISSYFIDPKHIVFFGLLHCMIACSITGIFFIKYRTLSLISGLIFLLLGVFFRNEFFDPYYLYWLGFSNIENQLLDFQPYVPYFGVFLLGISVTPLFKKKKGESNKPVLLNKILILIGQNTLLLYMAHAPFIFGVLFLIKIGVK